MNHSKQHPKYLYIIVIDVIQVCLFASLFIHFNVIAYTRSFTCLSIAKYTNLIVQFQFFDEQTVEIVFYINIVLRKVVENFSLKF